MSRLQLALNVNDIDEAVTFYTKLFSTEPAKRRPGYANFAITEPPRRRGPRRRHGRRHPDPTRGRGTRLRRRARNHVLLRQAGQVLGPGRT
jgi:catechol 2,3-dioxygenase-like lactoylglutathione lyase family enzyme